MADGEAAKFGHSGLGAQGMSALVPGLTLWRTRVRHEHAAAEAFHTSWDEKQKKKKPDKVISDASYNNAMSQLSSFREEIRLMQAAKLPPGHPPRGLPDVPAVGNFSR